MQGKHKIAAALVAIPFVYGAAVFTSTAIVHGYAAKAVDPIAARNVRVFATAPVLMGYHNTPLLADWGAQQRRISFNLLADNRMVDWSATAAFNNKGRQYASLIASYNISLMPELELGARPALVVDEASGCLKLFPIASASQSASHAAKLLHAFATANRAPGTYAYIGEDADLTIMHFALPPGKTAADVCSFTQPPRRPISMKNMS